jgi:hypothetical protein
MAIHAHLSFSPTITFCLLPRCLSLRARHRGHASHHRDNREPMRTGQVLLLRSAKTRRRLSKLPQRNRSVTRKLCRRPHFGMQPMYPYYPKLWRLPQRSRPPPRKVRDHLPFTQFYAHSSKPQLAYSRMRSRTTFSAAKTRKKFTRAVRRQIPVTTTRRSSPFQNRRASLIFKRPWGSPMTSASLPSSR